MALQCGIVGLPNVGKSTLFNALTSAKAEMANYPFCTIDPNVGVVTVPDERLEKITALVKPEKKIPTTIEFVDIAGLVKGASQGEGLGNQFLANIRETDAIVHVVRCFEDENIVHVNGNVDPKRDMEVINTELMLADLDSMDKRLQRIEKQAKSTKDPQLLIELSITKKVHEALSNGKPARTVIPEEDEKKYYQMLQLLTSKPILYLCNIAESEISTVSKEDPLKSSNKFVREVAEVAKSENNICLAICSAIEAEISQLEPADQKEFLDSVGLTEPGLHKLIRASYELLNLITYFTAGEKEVRAWTVRRGTKAPQAAGVIHSDFERGFIRAETYNCEDLFKFKSEQAVKEAGKYRQEGKEYVTQDGDIYFFKFNV